MQNRIAGSSSGPECRIRLSRSQASSRNADGGVP